MCCCFQRSGRSEPVTGTCRLSPRRRRRSLPPAAKGNASCSTTSGSFPEFTLEDRGWTRPTMTLFPCGSAAPSWSHSTFRPQVGVGEDAGTPALQLKCVSSPTVTHKHSCYRKPVFALEQVVVFQFFIFSLCVQINLCS